MHPLYLAAVVLLTAFTPPSLGQGYGSAPVKGKKHRTTTTTTLPPDIASLNFGQGYQPGYNPISSTPVPDNSLGSYNPPPQSGGSGSYWWQNPNSPFSGATAPAPSPQPGSGYPGGCGGGSAGGCGGVSPGGGGVSPGGGGAQPPINIQGNPFLSGLKPGSGSQQPPIQPTGQTVTCSGPGYICAPKHLCRNGVVVQDGQGLFQVRSETQYCDASTQACCQLPSGGNIPSGGNAPSGGSCGGYGGCGGGQPAPGGPQPSPGSPQPFPGGQQPSPGGPQPFPGGQQPFPGGQQPFPGSQQPFPGSQQPSPGGPKPSPGSPQPSPFPSQPPFSGNNNAGPGLVHIPPSPGPSRPGPGQQYPSASIPSPTYSPSGNNLGQPVPGTNGVPIGGSIYDTTGRPVTQAPGQNPYTGPLNTTPHPGCAAALKCVQESYCTAEGVMADRPVSLTREQYENRVPLADCADPDTGVLGKCCRDPNYKDPWPGGMMMKGGGGVGGGQHLPQQFNPQSQGNECGPSATCQPTYQCGNQNRVQPIRNCRVPLDGSSGVCCSSTQPGGAGFPGSTPSPSKPQKKPTGYPQPKPSSQPFPQTNPSQQSFPQTSPSQQPFPQTSPSQKPFSQTGPSQQPFPQTSPSQQPFPQSSPSQKPFPQTNPSQQPFPQTSPSQQFPHPGPTQQAYPSSSKQPFSQTGPTKQPFPHTSPSQQPFPQTGPSQQPYPSSTKQPFPQTSPSQQPFPQKSPSQQPFPQTSPSKQPFPQTSPSQQSFPHTSPSQQPFPQTSPSQQSFPHTSPSQQSFPQTSPSQQPFPHTSPSQQPFPHTSPSQQPFSQTSPSQQPFPHSSPSQQPFPQTSPSQQPFPQTSPSQQQFPHTSPSQQPFPQTSPSQKPFSQTSPPQQPYPYKPSTQPFPQNLPSSQPSSQSFPQSKPLPEQKPSSQPFPSQPFPTAQPSQTQSSSYPRPIPGSQQQTQKPFPSPTPGFPNQPQTQFSGQSGQLSPKPGAECGIRRQVSRQGLADTDAGFGEFPWQALVLSNSKKPLCSAAIISDRAVVTAAHCVQNVESSDLLVQAGVWKLNSNNQPKPIQTQHVAAIARHPNFDPSSLFNDLAILLLASPLTFDDHVDKICLPPKGKDISQLQRICIATGWGKQAIQGNVPESILHQIPVNLIPHTTCEEKLRQTHLGRYFILNPSFQCAVPAGSSQDLCKVDAGGPVACDRGDGHHELSGTYSWDIGCNVPNSPTVFGGIDTAWIESILARPVDDVARDELNEILKQQQQEELGDVDIDNKPGFSQGYGKK